MVTASKMIPSVRNSVDTSDFSATYKADKNQYYFDGEIIVEFTVKGD